MCKSTWFCAAVAGVLGLGLGQQAQADLSAYISTVGFDDSANLDRSMGLGVRWGKSSRIIGGETSLLLARPAHSVKNTSGGKETATALFYEGRLMVNLPLKPVAPFVNVGFGRILRTSTDAPQTQIPTDINGVPLPLTPEQQQRIETANKVLKAASKLQQNTAFSYGVGARKALNDRLDLRVDLRQYAVFSVKGIVTQKLQEQAAGQVQDLTGIALPVEKKKTVRYEELSLGVNFRF
ncbi:MAG: outer membrane beta-barrel protein [Candidatus Latescibacteria bacterium]|nr:outer membrane beta-barrel protein [Candidatus Latescibacterota bacterium]